MILLSTLSVIRHLNLIYETPWTGEGSSLLISIVEKIQLISFDQSNNTGATEV